MSKKNLIPILILCFLLSIEMNAQQSPSPVKQVVIPRSQVVTIKSGIVQGQEYELHILLPASYGDTTKTFPVQYLLDSQWDFPLLASLNGSLVFDKFIPESIVVGVTWVENYSNPILQRARDFAPTYSNEFEGSGHAADFLSFMKKELIPFVESNFRVKKNDRTLIGSSLGGLFTLYALFTETDLFQRYILTSPSIHWADLSIYNIEKDYAAKSQKLPVRLFMAHGESEGNVDVFNKWVNHLNSRKFRSLEMQTRLLENTGHSGTKAEGYARGLQWVFKKK